MQTVTVKLKAKDYKVLIEESRKLGISVEEFLARLAEEYVDRKATTEEESIELKAIPTFRLGKIEENLITRESIYGDYLSDRL